MDIITRPVDENISGREEVFRDTSCPGSGDNFDSPVNAGMEDGHRNERRVEGVSGSAVFTARSRPGYWPPEDDESKTRAKRAYLSQKTKVGKLLGALAYFTAFSVGVSVINLFIGSNALSVISVVAAFAYAVVLFCLTEREPQYRAVSWANVFLVFVYIAVTCTGVTLSTVDTESMLASGSASSMISAAISAVGLIVLLGVQLIVSMISCAMECRAHKETMAGIDNQLTNKWSLAGTLYLVLLLVFTMAIFMSFAMPKLAIICACVWFVGLMAADVFFFILLCQSAYILKNTLW